MISMRTRLEVMKEADKLITPILHKYLGDIETMWQPSDLLPDSRDENFLEEVKEIKESSRELSYDLLATLVGDMITEESLPTYETWIMSADGFDQLKPNNWTAWLRGWTAEENRHGDLLHKYLYMCGRLNMREVEITTQHLINDGFDPGMGMDPYKNFVYTSFQELATNISHRRTGTLAKKAGCNQLAKICGIIAGDEMRHAGAYADFVELFLQMDPNETMVAFGYMMKHNIVMPAHFMRESGAKTPGEAFKHFSHAAQRAGVYTTEDYVEILEQLIDRWKITEIRELDDDGERARDYVMALPSRMKRLASRIHIPTTPHRFKWISH